MKALLTSIFCPSPALLCPLLFFFFSFLVTATPPPVSGLGSQCLSEKGEDYRGRIAITESGNACQHWNTQFPHKHGWIPDRYPCKYAEPHHSNKYQAVIPYRSRCRGKRRTGFPHLCCYIVILNVFQYSLLLFRSCFSFFSPSLLILIYFSHLSPPHPTAELYIVHYFNVKNPLAVFCHIFNALLF